MPAMSQPPSPPARRQAEGRGGPPWDASQPPWEADASLPNDPPAAGPPWETGNLTAAGPPWETGNLTAAGPPWETGNLTAAGPPWETEGAPWEASDAPVPGPSDPAVAGPPWEAGSPPAAGPPWEASQSSPGGPPWPPSEPPPGARAQVPGEGPRTISAPPVGGDPFTRAPGDSPSIGSLPAVTGDLIRRQGSFTRQITRDGSSGFPVDRSRYQLYASLACPWSQRALIAYRILGLDRVIRLTLTDPVTDERGWRIGDHADPVTGARSVAELYRATDADYRGPFTLPLIWDMRTRKIVNNDVAQITVMLETEFRPFHRPGAPDLYPAARRREIDSLATLIFHTVNIGVYKAGLATTQAGYDQVVRTLFTTLDALDERLARRRFLLGDLLTEADLWLYPTLARFDAVYYPLFNCNLRRVADYQHLWAYARDLHTQPGFGETTDLGQIKQHYYQSAEWREHGRSGIVPIGPRMNWNEPHGRARMPS